MILDHLEQADRYFALHPGFAAGFAALRRADLATLTPGRHALDGERLVLIIGQDEGRGQTGAKLEAHRKYIDIQYVIQGDEQMGWLPTPQCQQVTEPFEVERDIVFFGDQPETWVAVPPGKFVVFYPEDAHAPLGGTGLLHKAVVKVAVEGW